jgi:hypothetical protein
MNEKLHHAVVRSNADRINRLTGISETGAPLRLAGGRRRWLTGALTLENAGYGTWSIARITSSQGGVSDIYRGKLRECAAFLEGIEAGLTLIEGNSEAKQGKNHASN